MAIKLIRTATVPESLDILLKGQLKFLSEHFEVLAVSGNNHFLENVQEREGVRVAPLSMERKIAPWSDLQSLIKLYRLFKKEKPQIVHSITPKAGLLSMVAARLAGVPIRIHTFTGLLFPYREGLLQKVLISMDKLLCACATKIIPEGQGVLQDLQKYKISSKPMSVIANGNVNGINTSYFSPDAISTQAKQQLRQSLEISEDDFVFIFVGRLVRDKGINELIQAFDKLSKEKKKVKLLLVGDREENLDPLEDKTNEIIKANANIIEAGYRNDVRPYFAVSQALAFPSYREGFPNVVLQAGAMGLPAMVTDINGSNEIIIEGENGVIVPAKNVEVIFETMCRFIEDNSLVERLAQNARKLIVERYDQPLVWNAILEEYSKLIVNAKLK